MLVNLVKVQVNVTGAMAQENVINARVQVKKRQVTIALIAKALESVILVRVRVNVIGAKDLVKRKLKFKLIYEDQSNLGNWTKIIK